MKPAFEAVLVLVFAQAVKGLSACFAYSVINMKKARLTVCLLLIFISSGKCCGFSSLVLNMFVFHHVLCSAGGTADTLFCCKLIYFFIFFFPQT